MKRINRFRSTAIIIVVMTFYLFISSCKKDESLNLAKSNSTVNNKVVPGKNKNTRTNGECLKLNSVTVYEFIEDENFLVPEGDATLLFNKRGHTPVLAPDGHQITLGEYSTVSGGARVNCIMTGTNVEMNVEGLIPNGVYTMWILTFKYPGWDITFANQTGMGALGNASGSENTFIASSDGKASLSVIMPEGDLSVFGSVDNCLASTFETHIVAAYHLDGLTHGGSPGDATTWIPHFAFPFFGSQL